MSIPGEPLLELRSVSKRFPGTLAVDRVDFAARAGEVHALMGENGAGKSTLMNVIAGEFADYTGEIFIRGQRAALHTPALARAAGIGMIHQELSLALPLSVAENILAGRLPTRGWGLLDKKELVREASRWLLRVGLGELDPLTPVEMLSQHEAQLVEIAKALSLSPSILIMDEPTSALSRREAATLFELIAELKCRDLAIVYISHHIPEVFEVADCVTVMRDGRRVGSHPIGELSAGRLVELMVGQALERTAIQRRIQPGEARFVVKDFSRYGFFHHVSFEARGGEILGIGGLAGAGRSELARSLCGLDPSDEGEIALDGRALEPTDLRACLKRGLAYLGEDRKRDGLALALGARENTLAALNVKARRLVGGGRAQKIFAEQAADLQLYPPQPERPVNQFSGGNQQKILLAKWLATAPEVCILDEPTRGVDIGAKQVIHEAIGRLADQGKCVIVISSDLPELVALSDRVLIMRKGRFIREMRKAELSEEAVLLAANGG